MARIQLAYGNLADDATLRGSVGSADINNLKLSNVARVWRTVSDDKPISTGFSFVLSTVTTASAMVLSGLNLGANAQVRGRAGESSVDLDLTSSPLPSSSAVVSFGGATNGTRFNEFGELVAATGGRIDHDPRAVHNGYLESEDLTFPPAWPFATQVGCSVLSADTVTYHAAGGKVESADQDLADDDYTLLAEVRLVRGDGSFKFNLFNGSVDVEGADTHVATQKWQWFRSTIASGAATIEGRGSIVKAGAGGTLQIRCQQISRGSAPLPYRRTLLKAVYQCLGLLREPASTNLFTNTATITGAAYTASGAGDAITPDTSDGLDGATNTLGLFETGATPRTARFTGAGCGIDATATVYCVSFTYRGDLAEITGLVARGGSAAAPIDRGALLPSGRRMAYAVVTSGAGGTAQLDFNIAANAAVEFGEIQVEKAQAFPTSLIRTSGASVTRTALTATAAVSVQSTEGTLYTETVANQVQPTSTVVTGGVSVKSTSSELVALRLVQQSAATSADAVVVTGGVTVWNAADSTVGNGAAVMQALRYKEDAFSVYTDGAETASNGALAVPTGYALATLDLAYGVGAPSHLKRVTWWPQALTAADLAALTTAGPGAVDYDSGWVPAVQMHFADGAAPEGWGRVYDVILPFAARLVGRGWIEIYDPSKITASADTVDVGRFFIGRHSLQPEFNAEYSSIGSGWTDLSTSVSVASGRKIFNNLPKVRGEAFSFPHLTAAETNQVHEMTGRLGLSGEVLYLRDPSDAAACQQYGMVGLLSRLEPLRVPQFAGGAAAFQIEKKL